MEGSNSTMMNSSVKMNPQTSSQGQNTQQERQKKKRKAEIDLTQFYQDTATIKKTRRDCPYLGQIKRHMLDFDFEKQCSVTLSNMNVYSCLTCGKYYQGKGKGTQAYMHSLEDQHHIYINLKDCKIWCLPDNYEVEDASLNDIKYNMMPVYTQQIVEKLDTEPIFARALDGTDFYPGCLGLNNLKLTDYVNVIIQSLCRIKPLRDHCLFNKSVDISTADQKHILVTTFSDLLKKIWNPKNFKGHVSPHELLQSISIASGKKFKIGEQKDPIQLLQWFLNTFNEHLLDKKLRKKSDNIIKSTFQGKLEMQQLKPKNQDINRLNKIQAMKTNVDVDVQFEMSNKTVKFFTLTMELPQVPLFRDTTGNAKEATLPQIPLMTLMKKFDGKTFYEEPTTGIKKKFKIYELPQYLIIHIKRFSKNEFFVEKNPTIVNFPIKNLDLSDFVWSKEDVKSSDNKTDQKKQSYKYDLLANIIHEGKPENGVYRVQVRHKATDEWFDIQDLHVNNIMPQQVTVSECYILIFERQSNDENEQ